MTAAVWAYAKFRKYEKHWLASQAQPALDVTVKNRVLPGSSSTECVLALTSTIVNRGKVNTVVDLDRSWFLVELASQVVVTEGSFVEGVDGKPYLVQNSLVDVATSRLRVKMSNIGPAVVRAGVSLSQANVCQVIRGIYRVTAEYAVSPGDLQHFEELTDGYKPPSESYVVWSASTIVDGRALSNEGLNPAAGSQTKPAAG